MVDEADDMIMAMEEGREVDILQEVMKYSGLGGRRTLDFGSFPVRAGRFRSQEARRQDAPSLFF